MKQYIYKSDNFSSVGIFKLGKVFKAKLSDGTEKRLSALSPKDFEKYRLECKKASKSFTLLGKTKLKALKKSSDGKSLTTKSADAVFSISSTEHFEVRNKYSFARTAGYLPVGENQFVEIVKFNPIVLLIAALILCAFISFAFMVSMRVEEETRPNPYIEEIDIPETNKVGSNETRYILNITYTINKSSGDYIISGMNFENWNEGKNLVMRIKLHPDDKNYIYDSGMIPYGSKIDADYLDDQSELTPGEYETLAECYVYNDEKEQLSHTSFEITLIVN